MDELTKTETPNGVVVLSPGTRLDASNSSLLKKFFQDGVANGQRRFVLDMSTIDFIDSMGLGALVVALKAVTATGGDIRLAGLSPEVGSLIELTRLDKVFDIHETVDAAAASYE